MTKFLTKNLEYRGHLSTFRAKITPKSGPFKVENNAQTLPKQLQNNFEKVQKTVFSTPKMAKSWMSTWPKVSILGPFSGFELYFWLVGDEKNNKIFPPYNLNDLKKKEKKYT